MGFSLCWDFPSTLLLGQVGGGKLAYKLVYSPTCPREIKQVGLLCRLGVGLTIKIDVLSQVNCFHSKNHNIKYLLWLFVCSHHDTQLYQEEKYRPGPQLSSALSDCGNWRSEVWRLRKSCKFNVRHPRNNATSHCLNSLGLLFRYYPRTIHVDLGLQYDNIDRMFIY